MVIALIICIFIAENKQVTKQKAMITNDKITEIFCIIDEFDKNLNEELKNNLRLPSQHSSGKRRRNISYMASRRTWRTNSCRLKKRLCSGKDISSSALTSCLKPRLILCIHVIALYTTSSWTSARHLLRIASSTTSLMRCLCMWKTQDNLNCLNCNLIPNWRMNINNLTNTGLQTAVWFQSSLMVFTKILF